jgi:hypothetical protein
VSTQIQIRRDTTTNWEDANPTLADGEIGFDTAVKRFKVGDGVTPWNGLDYTAGGGSDGGGGGSTADAVAVGEMSTGDMVVANADGTVSIVAGNELAAAVNAPVNATPDDSTQPDDVSAVVCMDLKNNRVVIASQALSANRGQVIVGEISGETISFGAPVIYISEDVRNIGIVYEPVAEKVVVTDRRSSGTRITATVLNILPETNSATIIDTDDSIWNTTTRDSSNNPIFDESSGHVLVSYSDDQGGNYVSIAAFKLRANGVIDSAIRTRLTNLGKAINKVPQIVRDPSSGRLVLCFKKDGNPYASDFATGTVSESGAASFIDSGVKTDFKVNDIVYLFYDPTSESILCVFYDSDATAIVAFPLKVSASNGALDLGEPVTLGVNKGGTDIRDQSACYNPITGRFVVTTTPAYGAGQKGGYVEAWISESGEVGVSTPKDNDIQKAHLAYDPVTKYMILAGRSTSTATGTFAQTIQVGGFVTNLTGTNFIGVSKGDYSDGDDATVQVSGVNSDQQGLVGGTAYYVQPDGSLSTSEGKPSVFAGTAIGPTKLNIKA